MKRWRSFSVAIGALMLASITSSASGNANDASHLMSLLESRRCNGCNLQNADLIHADLRDAKLQKANLQRANLSASRLDGADLRGADLSYTTLAGASLRGADLRGAQMLGTDLRETDLSGTLLDAGALAQAHWQQARGINLQTLSYTELHNAGVSDFELGNQPRAEAYFSSAIQRMPEAAISWLARGLCRMAQGKRDLAIQDLTYAGELYAAMGDLSTAKRISVATSAALDHQPKSKKGNGAGSAVLSGAISAFRMLAPLAMKALAPAPF